jgi:4-amino-4-deoxy-L-arabinose transferase-like glycosyltransferase
MLQHPPIPTRRSVALIVLAWAILQLGGLFSPGLLDDVDSVYLEVAREMLQRHDYVTPTIDGIRFFDKPPLMYWMAAGSMKVFGVHDWAARLPLALGVLALLLAVYALGRRLYPQWRPCRPLRRPGARNLARPYLYTRFYIPDILIALWMTVSVHLFLIALDRTRPTSVILSGVSQCIREAESKDPDALCSKPLRPPGPFSPTAPLLPMLGFAAVLALSLLTKGLIGIVFPLAFVLLYLALTRQIKLLAKLHLIPATLVFLASPRRGTSSPRCAIRPSRCHPGLGLPARAGWAWFYLYNEHIARFLGRRIPTTTATSPSRSSGCCSCSGCCPGSPSSPPPCWNAFRTLRAKVPVLWILGPGDPGPSLSLLLWPAIILGFFTLSSRQEYYHLPALPALAMLVGGLLAAAAEAPRRRVPHPIEMWLSTISAQLHLLPRPPRHAALLRLRLPRPHCAHTAPRRHTDRRPQLQPANYNLSLGHLFDLTGQAMGFFRGPLIAVAFGMLVLGPVAYLVRRRGRTFAANLTIAAGMIVVLLAAHEGLARFYPILGSKDLALAIDAKLQPGDLIVLDGELTSGSTLLFYTPQRPAPCFWSTAASTAHGSGASGRTPPDLFPDDAGLDRLWAGRQRDLSC